MIRSNIILILCLFATLGYFIGLLKFFNDVKEDQCAMIYMFEYPQFVRISNTIDSKYPKYGLFAYSEGRFTSKTRNMEFNGIPVLFIPGNAGSLKQVRSLASVALRKALNSKTPFHFDYYTVDLNDEYSGLYGPLLYDQLEYGNASIYRILELYKNVKNKPTSVIIIGHSMGGIVAMNLLKQSTKADLIPIVILLATPLPRAPVIFDRHMQNFYEATPNPERLHELSTVVALSGGYRDRLTSPHLCLTMEDSALSVASTQVPKARVESDHLQILWCKQLVLALNRALFDSVNATTKQISLDASYRRTVFNHHLIQNSGVKVSNLKNYLQPVRINNKGEWIESVQLRYSVQLLKGLRETHWYMVAISNLPNQGNLAILAVNLEVVDWVFVCNANFPRGPSRVCTEAVPLTHLSEIAPSEKFKRRYLEINMKDLKKNNSALTHVVFRGLPTNEPLVFHVDVHDSLERQIHVNLPKIWSFGKHMVVKTTEKAVRYDLMLDKLEHIIQNYYLFVEPESCTVETHHASASLRVPWGNQDQHAYFTNSQRAPLNVRLYTAKPLNSKGSTLVRLILDPSCNYKISIQSSIIGTLGQIARTYSLLLLSNVAAVILLLLKNQLGMFKKGRSSTVLDVINEGATPFRLLLAVIMFETIFSYFGAPSMLPKPDVLYLTNEGTYFFLLPILSYMCALGLFIILAISFCFSLIALESTVNKLVLKLMAKTVSFNMTWSDYLLSALHKVPVLASAALIILSLTTCGALALCLGTIFYFLKLTQMSQDFMEDLTWMVVKKLAKWCKSFFPKKSNKPKKKMTEPKKNNLAIKNKGNDIKETSNKRTFEETKETVKEKTLNPVENILKEKKKINKGDSGRKSNENINERTEENKEPIASTSDEDYFKVLDKDEDQNKIDQKDGQSEREQKGDKKSLQKTESQEKEVVGGKIRKLSSVEDKDNDETFADAYSPILFHSTLFFIWVIITLINIPAALTWAHNFKYNKFLAPDNSFIPGLTLSICAVPLWQFEFPRKSRKWTDKVEIFVTSIAFLSLIFATISLYRLNYLLTLTVALVTLQQQFAPSLGGSILNGDDDENKKDSDDEKEKVRYEDIKAKLE